MNTIPADVLNDEYIKFVSENLWLLKRIDESPHNKTKLRIMLMHVANRGYAITEVVDRPGRVYDVKLHWARELNETTYTFYYVDSCIII